MVMITLDIPKEVNKQIEHFKIERDLKDKRDAIVLLLKGCMKEKGEDMEEVFKEADKMAPVKISIKQLRKMKEQAYAG